MNMNAPTVDAPVSLRTFALGRMKTGNMRRLILAVMIFMVFDRSLGVSIRRYKSHEYSSTLSAPSALRNRMVGVSASFPKVMRRYNGPVRVFKICTRDLFPVCCNNRSKDRPYIADNPCTCDEIVDQVGNCTFDRCDIKCPGRKAEGKPVCCMAKHWGRVKAGNECLCKCMGGTLCKK